MIIRMKSKKTSAQAVIVLALSVLLAKVHAADQEKAIWHCSKMMHVDTALTSNEMTFSVASVNGTIDVSLDDLLAAYSGYPVRVSGKPLLACFMAGDEALSVSALNTLGLNSAAMQMLSRRSAIVQRNLKLVTDEEEMLSCMEKHVPAFGYLSKPISNDRVAPCF